MDRATRRNLRWLRRTEPPAARLVYAPATPENTRSVKAPPLSASILRPVTLRGMDRRALRDGKMTPGQYRSRHITHPWDIPGARRFFLHGRKASKAVKTPAKAPNASPKTMGEAALALVVGAMQAVRRFMARST